ncbi:MAG: biopolymer transporter ExbD [Candidatus Auribacterota bacterium]|jgi:biopolymer transport protein ExbD/biopolymer transport protein TolR|uniref:Biopolymer transporter ExbD n=1 Tax=Candidatus Auribacter fodinae TaxID=2093366 RepID=A0A3A4R3N5_9BACT|nr:MAG: biopolymer transporter ExbD [Candidatus Auribacter fodinae]
MKFKRRPVRDTGRFDITPLVDVVFLLLIFFMLSSSFILQPGIPVDLPQANETPQHQEENLVVTLTREHQLFFNNERVTFEGLQRRLRSMARKNKDGMLIIKADANTRHGRVVDIMNSARQAGIERMAIATQPEKKNYLPVE